MLIMCVVVVAYFGIGWFEYFGVLYPSSPPLLGLKNDGTVDLSVQVKTGESTALALSDILSILHGDWTGNDIPLWPTMYFDDPQSYQEGMLHVVSQFLQALVNARESATTQQDQRLVAARSAVNAEHASWMTIPSFEDWLHTAISSLSQYRESLKNGSVSMPPRRDTYVLLVGQLRDVLGSCAGNLSHAPRIGTAMTMNTAGDTFTSGERLLDASEAFTPWARIDNVFYFCQGTLFATSMLFNALRVDFHAVLENQKADELARAISLSMDPYYWGTRPFLGVVFNGNPYSLLPNHSSALAAAMSRHVVDIAQLMAAVHKQ